MLILELNFEKSWRGGERQTLYNMEGFRKRGHEVHIICRRDSPLHKNAAAHGFSCFGFPSIFGVIGFLLSRASKYDILHAQTAQILTYCVFTKWFHHTKIVFTRRVNFIPKGFFTKLKYSFTDRIVAISHSVQKIVSDFSGRNDVAMISSAIIPQPLNKTRASEMLYTMNLQGKKIIATTAALTAEKEPFLSIESIRLLLEKRNDIVFLHFGDGVLKEAINNSIKEKGLDDIYLMMGHMEKVEDFFTVMDVFTITSNNEGLCSSVLDSFIYKVPVTSTNAGGLKDLVVDGRAIECEVGDAAAIAEGIHYLLENEEARNKQLQLGYDFAVQQHNLDHITDEYIQLFNDVLKK